MKITWLGHSAFTVESAKAKILIDPFITGNARAAALDLKDVTKDITHIVLTHGHGDHIGDTIEVAKEKDIPVIANADLASWLASKGVAKVEPGNTGGTQAHADFTVTFVNALHSSAFLTEDGVSHSLGSANGLVFHFDDAPTLYHMGDTDIFSDMALINELHQPQIGLVPVGDRFTMGGAVAALACQRYFNFDTVLPCHYGTFPILDQTADKFVAGLADSSTKVAVPEIGGSIIV